MSKKDLSEREICTQFIYPSLIHAGWTAQQIREEVIFTKGQIIVRDKLRIRCETKRADYILYYNKNIPIAVIEAKDNNHSLGAGMQQSLGYADALQTPFVFSSNIAREIGLIPLINPAVNNFVLNVLSSSYFNNMIEGNLRGIAYKGLNLNILSNFIIPLPPLNEQKSIVDKVNLLFFIIDQLQVLQSKLQKTKLHLADALVANAVEEV